MLIDPEHSVFTGINRGDADFMRSDGQTRLKAQPFEARVLVFTDLPDLEKHEVRPAPARSEPLPETARVSGRHQRSGEIAAIISRFDAGYYVREYPDIDFQRLDPIMHFMEVGWYEGRNPNAFFDTVSYLQAYPDVEKAGINPYYHYLAVGAAEGRQVASSVTPSIRARLLFGRPIADWVSRISPYVDLAFYRKQLRRPFPEATNLAAHYAFRGWREGKRPNPDFDPASVEREEVLNRYLVNPLLIQVEADEQGALNTGAPAEEVSAIGQSPIEDAAEATTESIAVAEQGFDRPDERVQIEVVASEFDAVYYLATYPDVVEAGVDPLEHFFYTGWREGRNPNPKFDTSYYLEINADARNGDVNPFWHFLSVGRAAGHRANRPDATLAAAGAEQPAPAEGGHSDQLALVQTEFDAAYYIASYPDVAGAGVDPLRHFFFTGWREGRNPNQSFDSGYYLTANEDVRDAGLNPFWHYLVSGKAEGRLPRRPGGYRRVNIDAATAPSQRPPVDPNPNETEVTVEQLHARLDRLRKARSGGLIVSLSHDCYIKVIGGTQIFISDEQERFNALDYGYLHLSPQLARLSLSEQSPRFLVRVVADGEYIGLVELKAISAYLKKIKRRRSERAIYIVHCALGFHVPDMIQLWKAFRPDSSVFWLHDYSSLCPGFNLLRNDAEFCGAPPKDSLACRVCVYGQERASHLSQLQAMFEACNFDVLSPSQFALDLWLRSTELPRRSTAVHPHWQLVPSAAPAVRSSFDGPLPIAYLGYPSPNKGWQIFQEIVSRLSDEPGIRFSHFAARNVATLPKVEFVPTEVTAEDRRAALNALTERGIKVLLLLSPWPETFSFVLHEAIAAGAYIFCLADSGNVADVVQRERVGKVFRSVDDLVAFIGSGAAADFVREADAVRPIYEIESTGTTASSSVIHAGRA